MSCLSTRLAPEMTKPVPLLTGLPAKCRYRLLDERRQRIKRLLDILIAVLLLLPAIPVGAAIALAIRLETPGPIFFAHTRIGRKGRRFRLWKFRSMVDDAPAALERHFQKHPGDRVEWAQSYKLKDDPRVTRVGRWLRRSSLDELPQLWNVLCGDMSMVGPRPIVEAEVSKYGPAFSLYTAVLPGLTGLWQVSGRNDTTYRERIELDAKYVREWNLRMEARILVRTVSVVLFGHGAY